MAPVVEVPSNGGILDRIRYNERGYSGAESAIARAIIGDPTLVLRASVDTFAKHVGVSSGSVVRFAKRLGLSGYRDLRLAVASDPGATLQRPAGGEHGPLHSALETHVRALRLAMHCVDETAFATAADLLAGAVQVDILGVGAARATAHAALFQLSIIGLHCRLLDDPSEAAAAARFLGPGGVLLAISHSGRTRQVVDGATRARSAGAGVIALTSAPRSALAREATIVLGVDAGRTRYAADEAPFRTAHLAIAQSLCSAVMVRLAPADLARRQARWAEARFDMRYDQVSRSGRISDLNRPLNVR